MESDEELVKRLRTEFPEQFMSLVKMHLSLCLDQCTDEVDCLTPQTKVPDKRSLLSTRKTSRISKHLCHEEGIKFSAQIYQIIDYLSKPSSLQHEGVFRRNGKVKQQQELLHLIKEKNDVDISDMLNSNLYSVHEVATVLKNFLAEMPEPLLIESYYPLHCSLAKLNHPQRQIRGCQILVLLLPPENAAMLRRIFKLLHEVTLHSEANKMNALNLGIVLAPHILCPRKMSAEDLTTHASSLAHIVSFMIENANILFDFPVEFMDDVRLHSKRDPEEDASSTASTPPVKTTITFVDREMTAKLVADGDPTEAALAELYAYVQSQPESEVKKKWVTKFNKENGCGTPKVILNSSITEACAKNCKSISHSIRKHLFNGTGVTPKRRRSKSSTRSSALCYTSETSPSEVDDMKSPNRPQFGSQRNLLESTPVSEFIRHPACAKQTLRAANANQPLASIPPELAKENCVHHEQVISPLTQSAQRFPYYARDSIMTPRCRKPVFTFSPIDEPADDLVPNSDAIQLANLNFIHPTEDANPEDVNEKADSEMCGSSDDKELSPSPLDSASGSASDPEMCGSSDDKELLPSPLDSASGSASDPEMCGSCDDKEPSPCPLDSAPGSPSGSTSSSDSSLTEDSDSFLSGIALISGGSLTSPFKSYLMSREIQVTETDADDAESHEGDQSKISNSLLEILDGREPETQQPQLSPTRPSPPLTKSILFETSL